MTAAPNNGTDGSLYHLLSSAPSVPASSAGSNYSISQYPAVVQPTTMGLQPTHSSPSSGSDQSTEDSLLHITNSASADCECSTVMPHYPPSSIVVVVVVVVAVDFLVVVVVVFAVLLTHI